MRIFFLFSCAGREAKENNVSVLAKVTELFKIANASDGIAKF